MHSHLVMFERPKIGVIEGFVEEIHGMTLSSYCHTDDNGTSFGTVRTLLIGEELNPSWHIDSEKNLDVHILNHFPMLSKEDIRKCIQSAEGIRYLSEMFDDLKKRGWTTDFEKRTFQIAVDKYTHKDVSTYGFKGEIIGTITVNIDWIPSALYKLYSVQEYLRCHLHLVCYTNRVSQGDLDFMNELLKNQWKYGMLTNGVVGKEKALNDGVYTYYEDGTKELMSREEFRNKYPDSFEHEG